MGNSMHHEFREDIPLPPAEVYAYFRTPRDWTRLYGSFGDVENRGNGWYAVPVKRSPIPLVARITEDVPGQRVAWVFRGTWKGQGEVNFEPGETGTLVTGFEAITIPCLLGLGPIIERRLLEAPFQAIWDSGWRRLRRLADTGSLLEARPADTSARLRPSPGFKAFFDAPKWFYGHGLGWVLGKRFMQLSHTGRRSGLERTTVLEVAVYNKDTREMVVASAFGPKADWYLNIKAKPAHRVQVGRREFIPEQRLLEPEEARNVAKEFCRKHRVEARAAIPMFVAMGGAEKGEFTDPVDLLASLPMVAFRPA
jgi:deazaflavin-dependent oxidoreductase (nitroreductase family)